MVEQVEPQLAQPLSSPARHPSGRTRIEALDMTKGVLVVAMVVYHSFNYSTDYTLGFKYLPFLPPSFILITGFLISRLYFTPEAARDSSVYGRLLFRGFRLLLVFTILNVLTQLVGRRKAIGTPQGLSYVLDYWHEIFVIGGGNYAAFSILLPIAYLLLLAPLLMLLYRVHPLLVLLIAISVATFCTISIQGADYSVNLALLSAGLIGVILGRVPDSSLSVLRRYWYVPVTVYAGYIAFTHLVWQSRFDQFFNAFLALVAIFGICAAKGAGGLFGRELLIVGRYSLLAYIFQIALLQALTRLFGRLEPFTISFFLQMLGVGVVMILMAEGLQWVRTRAAWIDASYRFVFA
jgi:acyltransferase-like protein